MSRRFKGVADLEKSNLSSRIGVPAVNPTSQRSSTTYLRVFVAAVSAQAVLSVLMAMREISLKHFSGEYSFSNTCREWKGADEMTSKTRFPFFAGSTERHTTSVFSLLPRDRQSGPHR